MRLPAIILAGRALRATGFQPNPGHATALPVHFCSIFAGVISYMLIGPSRDVALNTFFPQEGSKLGSRS